MKKFLYLVILIITVSLVGFSYHSTSRNTDTVTSEHVSIAITENYGQELILEDTVTVASGTTVLEFLKMVAEVETSYGGGFVSSINGIKSSYPQKQYDWFLYINGFLAKEGASDYTVTEGDLIQWDYHSWETVNLHNAVLGCYPNFFVKGYANKVSATIIVFEDEFAEEAFKLKKQLTEQYYVQIIAKTIDSLSEEEKSYSNIIILAHSDNPLVLELNNVHMKIGFSAFLEENNLIALDYTGNPCQKYNTAAMIQVTQNIWNPKGVMACENIILLISGTDTELIRQSSNLLLSFPIIHKYSFGLIVTENNVLAIPCY